MSLKNLKVFNLRTILTSAALVLSLVHFVQCQDVNDYNNNQFDNPAVLPLITQVVYSQISNLTAVIGQDIGDQSSFCIRDWNTDWDRAFNFSTNLDFLASCIQKTNGDITRRMCSAAELKFYFNSFFERSGSTNYLKPNKNCNLTSWVEGCEPGWACSVGSNQKVNLNESKVIPTRTLNCQACCEGFFCPHGLTYMIRNPNHTCGGANIWADVGSSSELFCSAGSYCPSTTSRQTCTSGGLDITAGWVLHLRNGHPNVKAIHSSKGVREPPFFSGLSCLFCHQRCHYSCKSRSGL